MTDWTPDELEKIGGADELRIASHRPDGSLRPYVTIWSVRSVDALFVRSAHGPQNGWFRRAQASGTGRIQAGGVERDVIFEESARADDQTGIDAAYHAKYDRYGASIVNTVVGDSAHGVTLRLTPR